MCIDDYNTSLPIIFSDLRVGKEDYVPGFHTITIPANSISGDYCTDIQEFIVDDDVLEDVENFNVELLK